MIMNEISVGELIKLAIKYLVEGCFVAIAALVSAFFGANAYSGKQ